ncbi:GPP34 family phosphoprotein [Cryobacterium sandaracinum]|uniref:GPP34 family phosphoprotein n=1 Tax=Cryobacterium sandaracinum TaxID=1259247 RepID=A0ABY2JM27_9MICO|nr:GPP34 family phosphoprotein [Cryobacterium sandaracinum]TFD06373.1 GPP34 family phosphoprotein [Cryobacterium sandaracinum]
MTDATTSMPSIAEDVQLMLQQRPGQLEPDQIMPGAGALIELALEGRIRTDPKAGFLTEPADNARLVVVDDSPTGSAMLDDALAAVSARRRPPFAYKVLQPVTVAVVPHLYVARVERGVVRETGGYPTGRDRLEIADESVFFERKSVLARARTLPATVSDPRIGAVIDLLRNNGTYRGESGLLSIIAGDCYPPATRDVISSILRGVRHMSTSQ